MIEVLGLGTAATLLAPYLLPQTQLAPPSAIVMWLSVLALRAALTAILAAIVVLLLPGTPAFALLTQWCVHTALPLVATHVGVDGHLLGDVAALVPAALVVVSVLSASFGLWRAVRLLRRWLCRGSLGAGPRGSLIVRGSSVMVAAAGLRSPRVVVSTAALVRLDDAELTAGLEHEWGHVTRRHTLAAALGQLLHSVSRPLPGGRRALENLRFQLERDADDFAVRRTGDPLALASAICKASADAAGPLEPALVHLGGGRVSERLRGLLAGPRLCFARGPTALARLLAVAAVGLSLGLAASAPALAGEGIAKPWHAAAETGLHCSD